MTNEHNQQRTDIDLTENKQHNSHREQKAITLRLPEPRVLVHITPLSAYTSIVTLQFLPMPEVSEPGHLFLDSVRQSWFGHNSSSCSNSSNVNNDHNQQTTNIDLPENKQQYSHRKRKVTTLSLPELRVLVHITSLSAYTSIVTLQFLPMPEVSEREHLFLNSIRQS